MFIPKRRLAKADVLIFCFFTHSLDFFGRHNYSMQLEATHTMKHYPRISLRKISHILGHPKIPRFLCFPEMTTAAV